MALLEAMMRAAAHRGPDGAGSHTEAGLALGHRRLAIVDIGGGAQPMAAADGQMVLSFNGEIYNHADLRVELEGLGHRFRTRSDTEVILHAWREWGLAALPRLNGMFAFALWDKARAELVLARDRLGEKPLHYARLPDGMIAFASEPAALLALPGLSRRLDAAGVDDYLALGYVPDPRSIYAAIMRLPPGHHLVLARGSIGLPPPRRWWAPPTTTTAAPADAPAELAQRLEHSVRLRLMADVPLGCFLSGGVDSAAIAALASRGAAPLDTFTIGFGGSEDERPMARSMAALLGGRHHAQAARFDSFADAREVAQIFGEPFGDISAAPTLAVSRLARRHVTVALSGDGGDEVFAGYRRYRWHVLVEGVRRLLPSRIRRPVIGALARAYPKMDRAPRWLRARHTLTEISLDSALGYYAMVCKSAQAQRRALLSPRLRAELDGHDPAARFGRLMEECDPDEPLLAAQYADLHTYLPGDILTKVDRASMAASLEVRPPLLDHTFVEWGMALPARLKLRGGQGKHVLRAALGPILPEAVLSRRKQGFAAPIGAALRMKGPELADLLLRGPMLDSGLFDRLGLASLLAQHLSGRFDHGQLLWQLMVMQAFLAQSAGSPAMAGPMAENRP
jgi:asparagine synthase (glutamine-hydrolysing)